MEKILITGASGFIGSFIVEEALRRDMEVWAAVRKSSSRRYLTDPRIHFIELDLSSEEKLVKQLSGHSFDYVVHAAGVTKCVDRNDFRRINTQGTINLVNALAHLAPSDHRTPALSNANLAPSHPRTPAPSNANLSPLKRFVYLSSLSIFGPIHEDIPYRDICDLDTPQPNTAYGKSKYEAEQWLDQAQLPFPYIVLRPTGVYGPRERDYFLMAKSIKGHVDFAVGYKPQVITFVYVLDVVQAVFLALERGQSGRKYFLTDGNVYSSKAFSDLIIQELGHPFCLRIKAPLWVLRVGTFFGECFGRLTGRISALNNDKYHILRQRNWKCDIQPARDELGYSPQWPLAVGVPTTIQWYKDNHWL